MPELPEVETVRQGLAQVTLAKPIKGGSVLLPRTIAHPLSGEAFLAAIKDTAIIGWYRRGKYLLARLTPLHRFDPSLTLTEIEPDEFSVDGGWLGIHLRMSGQLLWLNRDVPLQKHTRVRLFIADNDELRFVDTRTFGRMWWVPPATAPQRIITGLQQLGPEPFSAEFSVEYLAQKLHKRQRSIKAALLDQSLVAGVGNIYADEALFVARIRPDTACIVLQLKQIQQLHTAIVQVLQAGIEAGGTTFSSFLNLQGVNGNYSGVAWVYGRTGKPCRVCGTPIDRIKLAGRSSHFCPTCQQQS